MSIRNCDADPSRTAPVIPPTRWGPWPEALLTPVCPIRRAQAPGVQEGIALWVAWRPLRPPLEDPLEAETIAAVEAAIQAAAEP